MADYVEAKVSAGDGSADAIREIANIEQAMDAVEDAVSPGAAISELSAAHARVAASAAREKPRRIEEPMKAWVLAVCGDGGFMMNSQEMETAVRLKLNLVVLVLEDSA